MKETYPGIKGKTHGDKKLISPAPKAIKYSNIYPVFFIAAEIPAIDVIKASSRNFYLNFYFFYLLIYSLHSLAVYLASLYNCFL